MDNRTKSASKRLSDGVMGNVLHSVEFRDDGTLL